MLKSLVFKSHVTAISVLILSSFIEFQELVWSISSSHWGWSFPAIHSNPELLICGSQYQPPTKVHQLGIFIQNQGH